MAKMAKARILTSHTYNEGEADEIAKRDLRRLRSLVKGTKGFADYS